VAQHLDPVEREPADERAARTVEERPRPEAVLRPMRLRIDDVRRDLRTIACPPERRADLVVVEQAVEKRYVSVADPIGDQAVGLEAVDVGYFTFSRKNSAVRCQAVAVCSG
jgi:hypothetical protein